MIKMVEEKRTLKNIIIRIFKKIDEKLFERTYQELWEQQNKEIERLRARIIVMQRNEKKNIKRIRELEREKIEREIEIL